MTTRCKECGKKFEHDSPEKAKRALVMHIGRVHGNIKCLSQEEREKRILSKLEKQEGDASSKTALPTESAFHSTATDPKQRRRDYLKWWRNHKVLTRGKTEETGRQRSSRLARERRHHLTTQAKLNGQSSLQQQVHYCPRCGFSMDVLATALAVIERS